MLKLSQLVLLSVILIGVSGVVYGEVSSSSINWLSKRHADTLYCQKFGVCYLDSLYVTGNITSINTTTYNVTGEICLNNSCIGDWDEVNRSEVLKNHTHNATQIKEPPTLCPEGTHLLGFQDNFSVAVCTDSTDNWNGSGSETNTSGNVNILSGLLYVNNTLRSKINLSAGATTYGESGITYCRFDDVGDTTCKELYYDYEGRFLGEASIISEGNFSVSGQGKFQAGGSLGTWFWSPAQYQGYMYSRGTLDLEAESELDLRYKDWIRITDEDSDIITLQFNPVAQDIGTFYYDGNEGSFNFSANLTMNNGTSICFSGVDCLSSWPVTNESGRTTFPDKLDVLIDANLNVTKNITVGKNFCINSSCQDELVFRESQTENMVYTRRRVNFTHGTIYDTNTSAIPTVSVKSEMHGSVQQLFSFTGNNYYPNAIAVLVMDGTINDYSPSGGNIMGYRMTITPKKNPRGGTTSYYGNYNDFNTPDLYVSSSKYLRYGQWNLFDTLLMLSANATINDYGSFTEHKLGLLGTNLNYTGYGHYVKFNNPSAAASKVYGYGLYIEDMSTTTLNKYNDTKAIYIEEGDIYTGGNINITDGNITQSKDGSCWTTYIDDKGWYNVQNVCLT